MVFFKHPDYNAVIAVHERNGMTCLDFLAQGNSQVRKAGRVTGYTKRNPDRHSLFVAILPNIRRQIVAQRHGKGMANLDEVGPEARLTHKGSFRMQLFLTGQIDLDALGFEPVKHRPVIMNWPAL